MLSSLHFQYFSQYSCSSQQGTLLHYSNISCYALLSHPPIKFSRNTSKGLYHYRDNFYISRFSQSSDLFFFKSWYISAFPFSFSSAVALAGTTISIIVPFCSFLSITIRSGRLVSIRLSHWIFISIYNYKV